MLDCKTCLKEEKKQCSLSAKQSPSLILLWLAWVADNIENVWNGTEENRGQSQQLVAFLPNRFAALAAGWNHKSSRSFSAVCGRRSPEFSIRSESCACMKIFNNNPEKSSFFYLKRRSRMAAVSHSVCYFSWDGAQPRHSNTNQALSMWLRQPAESFNETSIKFQTNRLAILVFNEWVNICV